MLLKIFYMVTKSLNLGLFSLIFFVCFFALSCQVRAELSNAPVNNFYVTNGQVSSSVLSTDDATLYIAGEFTQVGPYKGSGIPFNIATGQAADVFPRVDGFVYSAVSDNNGGWYIGGVFDAVGGETINNLAHILANGTVDTSFTPNPNEYVDSLALKSDSSILYVSGNFTSIGGEDRNYLAAINTSTGSANSFNPDPDDMPENIALTTDGSILYVGGYFTSIGGEDRNYLAAINTSTGSANSFNPDPDDYVYNLTLTTDNSALYVGGYFTFIGGEDRNYLAAINTSTGLANSFNPDPNNSVGEFTLNSDNSILYVGGDFTSIGGENRNKLAAINTSTGLATSFNPNSNGSVGEVTLNSDNSILYVGGSFTSIAGENRNYFAAINTSTGLATSFNPATNKDVGVIVLNSDGSTVYLGGNFTSIGGQARQGLAAINTSTGLVTSFNPDHNDGDYFIDGLALSSDNSILYVGGLFSSIGGQSRRDLAAINTSTGLATSFNPNPNDRVLNLTLTTNGSVLYVGGNFTSIGGQTRPGLAAINTSTGLATSFNPNSNGSVEEFTLTSDNSILYVGGLFSSIGGQSRRNLAAINTSTGLATSFNPDPNNSVYNLTLNTDDSILYASGFFTSIGGENRQKLAAINTSTGLATSFNPNPNPGYTDVYEHALSSDDSILYVGGSFTSIGGQSRRRLAAISTSTGLANSFNPSIGSDSVSNFSLASDDSSLYVGGSFSMVGKKARTGFAVFRNSAPPIAPDSLSVTSVTETTSSLSWTDNSTDETSFTIERSIDGVSYDNPVTALADATSATISGLSANTSYWFRIKASNDVGDSSYATTASSMSTLAINPTTATTEASDTNKITVSWSASSVKEYYLSYNSNTANSGWITATTHTFSGLACGTSYLFSLKSRNNDNVETGQLAFSASTNNCSQSSYSPPAATGPGSSTVTVNMNQTGNLGSVDNKGVNYLTYINTEVSFHLPQQASEQHSLTVNNLDLLNNIVTITIASNNPKTINLKLAEQRNVDLNDDNKPDVTVSFIALNNNRVELLIKAIEPVAVATPTNPVISNTKSYPINTLLRSKLNKRIYVVINQANQVSHIKTLKELAKYKNQAIIDLEQREIDKLLAKTISPSNNNNNNKFIFTINLKLGDVNEQVKQLQKYLNSHNFIIAKQGPGSPNKETTIFGYATKQALVNFQKANKISPSSGYFGPLTRDFINQN